MKLYIVVRDDLPVGLQAAQACHAMREYQEQHPQIERVWYDTSKTLVILKCTDIWSLAREANLAKVPIALNFEPDLQGALTAVAIGPGRATRKLVQTLPLVG